MNSVQGLFVIALLSLVCGCYQSDPASDLTRKEQSIRDAFEEDFRRTYDPALGYPPKERLLIAYEQIERMRAEMALQRMTGVDNPRFVERGPINIGGRTRTIHIDLRDPERKTIWVGSVSGGLWQTDDITAVNPSWEVINDYLDNLAVGSLAQDPTNPEVFYLGTGEGFSNFEAVRGQGIFKSTDGGVNWSVLASTTDGTFNFTRALVVDPDNGDVYAGTRNDGVQRSSDGGETWIKVLGSGVGASDNSIYDLYYIGGNFYASNTTNIYFSETGARGTWASMTKNGSGFPTNLSRVEFTVCESNTDVLYAVGSINGGGSDVYRTQNGGQTWTQTQPVTEGDFTNGQAWYDLEIAVDPFECNHVIVGGVGIYRTTNGGAGWQRFAQSMHVDQHKAVFDPQQRGVVYFGNDGGIYRSNEGSSVQPDNKNLGYVTTQYYGCAMHPDTFSNYFLGGTQDNGTHRLNGAGATFGDNVWGGDGFYCHIDEDNPNIQLVSSQYGNWGLSTNGGITFSGGQQVNGGFITPSDYDSKTNILYTQTSDADFYRWNVVSGLLEPVEINGAGGSPTAVHVDPTTDNRVYFGTGGGTVIRIDNAHEGDTVQGAIVFSGFGGGTVSGIDVYLGDPDRILVSKSNYGIQSVFVTSNGGANWVSCEGNLPDIPVRSCLFNPRNPDQAVIATEAGVWTTTFLDGQNTLWTPPAAGRGIPITRTDDLEVRFSDYVVLAGTHGRGLWTTSVFSDARPKFFAPLVHYVDAPITFYGDVSLNADSYSWQFGDGKTSTAENPVHTYTAIGEYDVMLTINETLSTSDRIKILPDGDLPYAKGMATYGGDFEGKTEQYGVHTVSGSGFERGKSSVPGKNGTKSGDFAYVIGLNESTYQANSESYLYLPVFDLSEESIYTFSFWARYLLHPGPDGFLVEYSTDRGRNWQILGSTSSKKWYNFNNDEVATTAFPDGTPYFTGDAGGYTNFTHDLTFLSGQKDVAFRFVFRSESTGAHVGLAIDDVEIISYEGILRTTLTSLSANFAGDKDIEVKWTTRPEYYCKKFEIERSDNGRDFSKIDEVFATAVLSANATNYSKITSGGRDLYFYRLKVISENIPTGYYDEYYSDTITVRRANSGPVTVHSIFPNPFVDQMSVTFNDVVNTEVTFQLYDAAGRLLTETIDFVESPFYVLPLQQWPQGVYYLSIQIGIEDPLVYPLLSAGG